MSQYVVSQYVVSQYVVSQYVVSQYVVSHFHYPKPRDLVRKITDNIAVIFSLNENMAVKGHKKEKENMAVKGHEKDSQCIIIQRK